MSFAVNRRSFIVGTLAMAGVQATPAFALNENEARKLRVSLGPSPASLNEAGHRRIVGHRGRAESTRRGAGPARHVRGEFDVVSQPAGRLVAD